jgi:hypothetical protein
MALKWATEASLDEGVTACQTNAYVTRIPGLSHQGRVLTSLLIAKLEEAEGVVRTGGAACSAVLSNWNQVFLAPGVWFQMMSVFLGRT